MVYLHVQLGPLLQQQQGTLEQSCSSQALSLPSHSSNLLMACSLPTSLTLLSTNSRLIPTTCISPGKRRQSDSHGTYLVPCGSLVFLYRQFPTCSVNPPFFITQFKAHKLSMTTWPEYGFPVANAHLYLFIYLMN